MKSAIKNIANFILMVVLLVVTSGMTVYKLHCKCLHHEHISIYLEPQSCHSVSGDNHHSSSCSNLHAAHQHNHQSASDCDSRESFFVRLTTEFISEDHSIDISLIPIFIADDFYTDLHCFQIRETNENIFSEIRENPPLFTLSGQKIVTLFHQFKFDHQSFLS